MWTARAGRTGDLGKTSREEEIAWEHISHIIPHFNPYPDLSLKRIIVKTIQRC